MLDKDLAELYEIPTKQLNKAVKRNIDRFPPEFMFKLEKEEFLRFQSGTIKGRGKHRKYLPYVFTEQGVAMLSSVLRSKTAVKVSIQIMNSFVEMRKLLGQNYRFEKIERKLLVHDNKFEKIFDLIENKLPPEKGIFFDGQVFDAYNFVSDLIRNAEKSITLIDSYIDDSVLKIFCKRNKNVKVIIYTRLTKSLKLDLEKYNSQYGQIEIKDFRKSHDRFLIIDEDLYHFGASLKDLGKKWFAFSKMDNNLLNNLL